MDARLLVAIYLVVTLLPLGLAASGARLPRPVWDELASGAGMLAFSIILVEFVLSGRFRTVSGRIGMDVTMRLHQLFARTALGLALVHPFLYRTPFNPPYPWDTTRQLTLTGNSTALLTGILAWCLLPSLVLLAIARRQIDHSYEAWRLMHGLGALAIAGLVLHHTLGAGRYASDPVLAGLWIGLFALAVLTIGWVYLVGPLMQGARPWAVRSVRSVGEQTWELEIAPVGHAGVQYRAGQFAWLNVGHSPFSNRENPFSISSAPASGANLQFIIKEFGDFTSTVGGIAPGTRAHIDGPHGTLTVDGRTEPGIALIAGGVGIAPLLGILRQLHLTGDARSGVMIHATRTAAQFVHREEIEALARAQGMEPCFILSRPDAQWSGQTGRVDDAMIRRLFDTPERRKWLYVLCGPPAMMDVIEDSLTAIGVPARQLLSERFVYD